MTLPDTAWAKNLPVESIPAALSQLAALQGSLAARLAMTPRSGVASGDDLLDAPALAKRLGVPGTHVRTLQRAGAIPFVRVGAKYIRFRLADVEAALSKS